MQITHLMCDMLPFRSPHSVSGLSSRGYYFLSGGWWISWSPFVGMFIAKISRGRTIKDFIIYTLTLPSLYSFFWMAIFGGVGIQMQNTAEKAGMNCTLYDADIQDPSK